MKAASKWIKMVKRMGWTAEQTVKQARWDGQCKSLTDAQILEVWAQA